MREVLRHHFDFCSTLVVAVVAHLVFAAVRDRSPRFAPALGWVWVTTLVAACVYGYADVMPTLPVEILGVLIVAWVAACGAALAAAAVLPLVAIAWGGWRRILAAWEAEGRLRAKEREAAEAAEAEARAHQERLARLAAEEAYRRSLPPPPTKEEREAAVRKRYEDRLRLLDAAALDDAERQAARERAKQQYLRELEELME